MASTSESPEHRHLYLRGQKESYSGALGITIIHLDQALSSAATSLPIEQTNLITIGAMLEIYEYLVTRQQRSQFGTVIKTFVPAFQDADNKLITDKTSRYFHRFTKLK